MTSWRTPRYYEDDDDAYVRPVTHNCPEAQKVKDLTIEFANLKTFVDHALDRREKFPMHRFDEVVERIAALARSVNEVNERLTRLEGDMATSSQVAHHTFESVSVVNFKVGVLTEGKKLDEETCAVCFEAKRDCCYEGCFHVVCCTPCATKNPRCPMCRKESRVKRLYWG